MKKEVVFETVDVAGLKILVTYELLCQQVINSLLCRVKLRGNYSDLHRNELDIRVVFEHDKGTVFSK